MITVTDYLIDAFLADKLSGKKGWRTIEEMKKETGRNYPCIYIEVLLKESLHNGVQNKFGTWFLEIKRPRANIDKTKGREYYVFRLVPKQWIEQKDWKK